MGTGKFTDEFKRDAVAQIAERGHRLKEVSVRLGVSMHALYAWKRKFKETTSRVYLLPSSSPVQEVWGSRLLPRTIDQ